MADDPEERELDRRSRAPSLGPWVVICLLAILALAAYAISAVSA